MTARPASRWRHNWWSSRDPVASPRHGPPAETADFCRGGPRDAAGTLRGRGLPGRPG